ncbi:MAG: CBS domain-containing protein [Gemmatimonadota bacterium]
MRTRDILERKGREVVTVSPGLTVLEAMRVLVEHNIGAVVVVEGAEIRGILTERDVLRLGAVKPEKLATTLVGEAMTVDLLVGVADDDIDRVMGIMTENRIRHLPIVDGKTLKGILSIGDVVNALRKETEVENRYLRSYIQGGVR